jgi:hypothetical protein
MLLIELLKVSKVAETYKNRTWQAEEHRNSTVVEVSLLAKRCITDKDLDSLVSGKEAKASSNDATSVGDNSKEEGK